MHVNICKTGVFIDVGPNNVSANQIVENKWPQRAESILISHSALVQRGCR